MAELSVPRIDFSSLGDLGQTYRQAQDDTTVRRTLASLGQSPLDQAAAQRLVGSGIPSLATLGIALANQNYQHGRDARNDAWQQTQARQAQLNADRSFGLQQRAADRADATPLDKLRERLAVLQDQKVEPSSPEGRAYLMTGEWSGPGSNAASLTPIFGVDSSGKTAAIQPTKSGVAIPMKTPDGFSIAREPIKVDTSTAVEFYDPQTRQLIRSVPKDLAGAEREKVVGEETGKGMVALPQVLATSNETLKSIEDVRKHPGRSWGTGALGTIPGIPGTDQKGFIVALDQLKGKTFLAAFNSLRGGGAITESEGSKATNAMARLDRAQNAKDFEGALDDLRDVIKAGMFRAAAKSRGAGSMPTQGPLPGQSAPQVLGNSKPIGQEEYAALPSGSIFTAPDGTQRVKP